MANDGPVSLLFFVVRRSRYGAGSKLLIAVVKSATKMRNLPSRGNTTGLKHRHRRECRDVLEQRSLFHACSQYRHDAIRFAKLNMTLPILLQVVQLKGYCRSTKAGNARFQGISSWGRGGCGDTYCRRDYPSVAV